MDVLKSILKLKCAYYLYVQVNDLSIFLEYEIRIKSHRNIVLYNVYIIILTVSIHNGYIYYYLFFCRIILCVTR